MTDVRTVGSEVPSEQYSVVLNEYESILLPLEEVFIEEMGQ